MAKTMQENFSGLLGDKSWAVAKDSFGAPEYNANSKTIEIKYPSVNVNQIMFVYHVGSKTKELQFKGDVSNITIGAKQQLLIDQWEAINGKTYGPNEGKQYGIEKSDRGAEKDELAKGREIEKKIQQGQLDQITGKELDALKKALKEYTITESLSNGDITMYANFDVNERLKIDPMKMDPEVAAEKIINPKIKIIATMQAKSHKKMGGMEITVPRPYNGDIAYHEYTGLRVFINGADKLIKVTKSS